MWLIPASQATVTRRPATNRPITTVFGPWRSKKRSPRGSSFGSASRAIGIFEITALPPFRAIQYPVLSPTIGRESRDRDHLDDVEPSTRGQDARGDQRRLARKRDPGRLDSDQ